MNVCVPEDLWMSLDGYMQLKFTKYSSNECGEEKVEGKHDSTTHIL